jgi:hypothetical protein
MAKSKNSQDQDQKEKGQQEQGEQAKGKQQPVRKYWKGVQYRTSGSRSGRSQHPPNPVLQEWLPVENSEWQGVQVRTVGESLQSCYLNRQWWVTAVRRHAVSGDLEFQLTDDRLAVAYARPSEVVKVADDAQCTPAGPANLDYRQLKTAQRKTLCQKLCASLGRDVELAVRNSLVEQTTLAWALQEIQLRLPCAGVEFLSPAEVDAVCAIAVQPADLSEAAAALNAVYECEACAVLRARLNAPGVSRALAVVHSRGPSHYTLLDRSRSADGQYQLRYFDSLRQFSASGRSKAQVFADVCGWQLPVPEPANGRFQIDGWSCGLWCLQFAEEAVRQERGEAKVVPVVSVSDILSRVNTFIDREGSHRPAPVPAEPPKAPPPPASALTAVMESMDKVGAEAQATPVPTASVVEITLPPVPALPAAPVAPPPKAKPAPKPLGSAVAAVLDSLDRISLLPKATASTVAADLASAGTPASATVVAAASSADPVPLSNSAAPVASGEPVEDMAPSDNVDPVANGEFTLEMALEAAKSHSKCRFRGCAQCMQKYFVPRNLLRQWSRESGGSAASAEKRSASSCDSGPVPMWIC